MLLKTGLFLRSLQTLPIYTLKHLQNKSGYKLIQANSFVLQKPYLTDTFRQINRTVLTNSRELTP